MKYLLDTHVILRWLTETKKISVKTRKIISDKNNKIFLSSVSFWEMAIKQSIGRLVLPDNILDLLLSEGFELLTLSAQDALRVSDLPFIHNDPFDRMLIIQAKLNDFVFITSDKQLTKYPVMTLKA
jgi:PIN domain nuclease of toxin-antitoxin system